jgi:hypothetical protein
MLFLNHLNPNMLNPLPDDQRIVIRRRDHPTQPGQRQESNQRSAASFPDDDEVDIEGQTACFTRGAVPKQRWDGAPYTPARQMLDEAAEEAGLVGNNIVRAGRRGGRNNARREIVNPMRAGEPAATVEADD